MTIDEKATKLASYIKSQPSFQRLVPHYPYNHIGAIITDGILQAGLNWETVVIPRVNKVKSYSEAETLTGFLKLLIKYGAREILDWKYDEKLNRIVNIVLFFQKEEIETVADLKDWLTNKDNQKKLKQQRGVGSKTLDYFRLLSGISAVVIDRHVRRYVELAGIDCRDYNETREVIERAANLLGKPADWLSQSMWEHMRKEI